MQRIRNHLVQLRRTILTHGPNYANQGEKSFYGHPLVGTLLQFWSESDWHNLEDLLKWSFLWYRYIKFQFS